METLQEQVNKLEQEWDKLKNTTTIPKEIDSAFRARFANIAGIALSATSATAHNKTVDESGSSTYDVMNKPTGFLTVVINGTARDIPYF
jgi:hypothetical protein